MKTILNILDKRRPEFIWWLSVLSVIVICYAMFLAEKNIRLESLLVLPVLLVSWYGSSRAGSLLAVFAAISQLITNLILGYFHPSNYSAVYDSLVTLFACLFVAIIVTNFRKVHKVEVVAADTDALTGVKSPRSFYAEMSNEILRSKRYGHTFSIAYIDVDNFKKINDTFGHSTGDELLIQLSCCLQEALRSTDTIARIGGDEFICLLPETERNKAKSAIVKAEKALDNIMKKNGWDVSFSIGVVTFEKLPSDISEAVKLADELMYTVKNEGKNGIAYRVWYGVA